MSNAQIPLSKSLTASLASGIIATFVKLIFYFVHRSINGIALLHSILKVETTIIFLIIAFTLEVLLFHCVSGRFTFDTLAEISKRQMVQLILI